ncbi:substrate-binding domain-containing protein [Thioalkalivibrio paradoxus]|uniref:Tungsten ABC transporter substrate-binding protein n=1 Tax=Thioalkalivibrio paradoxus ARh 1 TaxID=713585 RepID=W0DF51_9GAMM|nr:substrate-binding domain-containing protein [Thioalkalivibrio paradoxus]AHE97249.1 tungsten ABC transporter substrate-binding protein [Thioalkalivibrio paradoxus ARh 1]
MGHWASRLAALPLLFAAAVLPSGPVGADTPFITLASTTSSEQSGLFRVLIPAFTERTGVQVRVVAVGTGQAFTIGRRGDADALLVHHREGEDAFVAEGFGIERRDVMYNDFVLIGPRADPADVAGAANVAEALQRIHDTQTPFTSRGDDSGTHRRERGLWENAGLQPQGRWYRELGSGMGAALNTAAAMNAYVLADRGTWLSFRNRQELDILFEGDPLLFNPYGSIPLDPERFPWVKADLAWQWHEWITSPEGQERISRHTIGGEPLFFPSLER